MVHLNKARELLANTMRQLANAAGQFSNAEADWRTIAKAIAKYHDICKRSMTVETGKFDTTVKFSSAPADYLIETTKALPERTRIRFINKVITDYPFYRLAREAAGAGLALPDRGSQSTARGGSRQICPGPSAKIRFHPAAGKRGE